MGSGGERAVHTRRRRRGLEVDGWRLGLRICYDGCFPEHGRAAADAGAHGYLCPSGYVVGSAHRRDLYYAARALDNTMYVVFANSVGGDGDWRSTAARRCTTREGRPVARAADEGEAVVVGDVRPGRAGPAIRAAHTMLPTAGRPGRSRICAC